MESYSPVSKWFHWVTVVLMAVALPVGFVIQHVTDKQEGATKMVFYAIHESAGVTLFLVVLARLLWRLSRGAPPLPGSIPAPLRLAANTVHHALYALLLLQPLLGFFATNAWGFPLQGRTAYLGFIELPKFMEANEALAGQLQTLHTIGGWTILVLLVLHVGGVVFHQAIRRDGLLLRMV
ncbi:cytochrome b/b6 domain-containing protein [Siccirubricoccus sp. KC 17139]|uniref:Cytochrome b/b6 domain-containing protein n=1 Tax=Siccirubricoccus soli TaxID=2899147 RepID=A0ABT1D8P4_9PROT|nr:cytochrome b/b6 domain-containing protein [Siccirubricoccus soli]MCO6418298.1 cytochrome b/b6 domain-containing protein [Siccirubricoccus soli]MCP2684433.1 cytochrome b/b6 domain-containing protein [Siccirubricoccus soli]